MSDKMDAVRAARLLRAKAGELENRFKQGFDLGHWRGAKPAVPSTQEDVGYLIADLGLVAGLLADQVERSAVVERYLNARVAYENMGGVYVVAVAEEYGAARDALKELVDR